MELETLIAECTAYDYKVTLEEKKPKSWLKSVSTFANGSGGSLLFGVLTNICNETKALDGYKDEMKPMFKSTPTQFQTTIYASSDEPGIEDAPKGDTQGSTQNGTQDVPQDVPQGVPEEGNLDAWIEEQIFQNPNITTEDLAKLSGFVSKTIKRHIAKMPHIKYVGRGYSGHWEITKE